MRLKLLAFLLLFFHGYQVYAQSDKPGAENHFQVHISYALQMPGADLADRFGNNLATGGALNYLTSKGWIVGLEGYYFFGKEYKEGEDPISILRTQTGDIIGADRIFASVDIRERGFYMGGLIGKIFHTSKKHPNSGIRLTLGTGLLQHKFRIQDNAGSVYQLTDPYIKGYDRLTNGLAFNEFIGYQYLSKNRLINFIIGIEMTQGFTQSRRSYNFVDMAKDETKRTDLLFGVKAAWVLPIYLESKPEEIFY